MSSSRNQDTNTKWLLFRQYGITAAKTVTAVMLLAAVVHVSWNMFAPDMFGLEAIRMKQALGLVLFTGVVAFVFGLGSHRKTPSTVG